MTNTSDDPSEMTKEEFLMEVILYSPKFDEIILIGMRHFVLWANHRDGLSEPESTLNLISSDWIVVGFL